MTTVDFARALQDAKSVSYEALPIGDYDVEVVESTALRSSNGKPMIKVQLQVLSGPYQNRRIFNNFVFSIENAMAVSIFFRHMKCFGLKEDFFAQMGANGSMEAVASALMGRRARVTLGMRQWQGEDRNEVNQIKPYTGAPGVPNAQPVPMQPMPAPVQHVPAPAPAPVQQSPQPVQVAPQPVQTPPPAPAPQPAYAQPVAQPAPAPTQGSGLDEFRPTSVPTEAGSSTYADASITSSPTQPTSEPQYAQSQPTPPAPPAAPALPI